jgi:hypothetical protein
LQQARHAHLVGLRCVWERSGEELGRHLDDLKLAGRHVACIEAKAQRRSHQETFSAS